MKFLLTGGAGFIGSHLAELLSARGDRVRIIDDLSTGGIENIQHLKRRLRKTQGVGTEASENVKGESIKG